MGMELGQHTGLSSPQATATVEMKDDSAQVPLLLVSLAVECVVGSKALRVLSEKSAASQVPARSVFDHG